MKVSEIEFTNFRSLKNVHLRLDGKTTVLFGINGAGKSSVIRGLNLMLLSLISEMVTRYKLQHYDNISMDDIFHKSDMAKIKIGIELNDVIHYIEHSLVRDREETKRSYQDLGNIAKEIAPKIAANKSNVPIMLSYSTSRLVADVEFKITSKMVFDVQTAFDKAIEDKINFQGFFEWFKNQEDNENAHKVEINDLDYHDKGLEAVRNAVKSMLSYIDRLRISRVPKLTMIAEKHGMTIDIMQMSDGEKCTLALLGDIARRLALANPDRDDPLLGDGVVLIDELELHMHPSWQRKILPCLMSAFPNVQFIVTTHSPIVLTEAGEDVNIFALRNDEGETTAEKIGRMDGYDANFILEGFMGTTPKNTATTALIRSIYDDIDKRRCDDAESKIKKLADIAGDDDDEVVKSKLFLRHRRLA